MYLLVPLPIYKKIWDILRLINLFFMISVYWPIIFLFLFEILLFFWWLYSICFSDFYIWTYVLTDFVITYLDTLLLFVISLFLEIRLPGLDCSNLRSLEIAPTRNTTFIICNILHFKIKQCTPLICSKIQKS